MPGDNEEIRVVLSAFEAEARKWTDLADLMLALRNKSSALGLNPTAFFCGNPGTALALSGAYDGIFDLVNTLLTDAEAEFDQIAGALLIARDLYDGTDRTSASSFVKIYGE
ncbi:hypothetical protein [Actinoplanes auranticolor]|uniref:Excreted virulence factor EspC (Type VII ESX diderm) n=1 Tax=Actinoplanes auranticolor TaxID=47988 RepID=A0A919VJB6_9ACTN|nr:hypothetical protein [Actinoplanes auranticolor]GIM65045.1 hypothetical protein Aau02nite_14320 [Actinoplanes auranticolor]